jgi:peptidoglycan/xylan/chitin deacetylase (PgdA/CDA1 family)
MVLHKKSLSSRARFKHHLRSCLDLIATCTGLLQLCKYQMQRGLTILMYHRILPHEKCQDYPLQSLVIPIEVFRRQVDWIAGNCKVLPVCEALEELNRGRIPDKPLVAVTFDDGYADNFEFAAPILEAKGLRGTFFVSAGFVEEGVPLWYDRAADAWQRSFPSDRRGLMDRLQREAKTVANNQPQMSEIQNWMAGLKSAEPAFRMAMVSRAESIAEGTIDLDLYRPMSTAQVAELCKRGHEIGSHTVTHLILPQLDDHQLRSELHHSAECLREWTGGMVDGFCYPNGDYDDRVEHSVKIAGYTYACAMHSGLNRPGVNRNRLARLSITMQRTMRADGRHDPLGFRAELCRLREWWR